MVHLRLNANETNPNPHINFISALPTANLVPSQNDAQELLRALAAQIRPLMKSHGFSVNSFEEYEYNQVFAGRNWNNGETIELVLRRPGGMFAPTSYLLSTLCHELAHISHMNHGPAFQALWSKLCREVAALQQKGYYGDGYWSSGNRLSDSAQVSSNGLAAAGQIPEYVCGGAQARTRPTSMRRGARRRRVVPSNHTGAQFEKRRKAGGRVTGKDKFLGESSAIDADGKEARGSGFGKQAGSKRAREERALAAERRLKALQAASSRSKPTTSESNSSGDESDGEDETDNGRRQLLLDTMGMDDLDDLKSSKVNLGDYGFVAPPSSQDNNNEKRLPLFLPDSETEPDEDEPPVSGKRKRSRTPEVVEISDNNDGRGLDAKGKGKARTPAPTSKPKLKKKKEVSAPYPRPEDTISIPDSDPLYPSEDGGDIPSPPPMARGRMNILKEEMQQRHRETSGMIGPGRMLDPSHHDKGDKRRPVSPRRTGSRGLGSADDPLDVDASLDVDAPPVNLNEMTAIADDRGREVDSMEIEWSCYICTLINKPMHLACAACATTKGERTS